MEKLEFFFFTTFTSGYHLLAINRLLSKFGRNSVQLKKVNKISKNFNHRVIICGRRRRWNVGSLCLASTKVEGSKKVLSVRTIYNILSKQYISVCALYNILCAQFNILCVHYNNLFSVLVFNVDIYKTNLAIKYKHKHIKVTHLMPLHKKE